MFILTSLSDVTSDDDLAKYELTSGNAQQERNECMSSGSDTEDEIEKVLEKQKASIKPSVSRPESKNGVYDQTTEEEQLSNDSHPTDARISALPTFFVDKVFYLSSNLSSIDEIKLKRFISVYGGSLTTMSSQAHYILSNSAKSTPAGYAGEVVKPLWVYECNDMECMLPTKRYKF